MCCYIIDATIGDTGGLRKGHARHPAGSVTMEGAGANCIRLLLVFGGPIGEGEVRANTKLWADM
jgi:hypothetical protein